MVWHAVLGLRVEQDAASMVASWTTLSSPAATEHVSISAHASHPTTVLTSHSSLEEPRSGWVVTARGHLDGIARLLAEGLGEESVL